MTSPHRSPSGSSPLYSGTEVQAGETSSVFNNSSEPQLNMEGLGLIWKGGRDSRQMIAGRLEKVLASVVGMALSPFPS